MQCDAFDCGKKRESMEKGEEEENERKKNKYIFYDNDLKWSLFIEWVSGDIFEHLKN